MDSKILSQELCEAVSVVCGGGSGDAGGKWLREALLDKYYSEQRQNRNKSKMLRLCTTALLSLTTY